MTIKNRRGRPRKEPKQDGLAEEPQESAPASVDKASLRTLIEREREISERSVATIDKCIAEVERMLSCGEYDSKLASHLAWVTDKRANAMSKLRQFGERVKTQSLELTDEQKRRAVAKFIQLLPVTEREEFRRMLDTPIEDIELIE